MMQPEHHHQRGLIADQAGRRSEEQRGDDERGSAGSPYMNRRSVDSVDRSSSDTLLKELEAQRKDVT